MLPNEITLAVDEDNDGGTTPAVNHDYRRFREFAGRTTYIHTSGHSAVARNTLDFYATEAKPAGNFCGVRRSAVKFTVDYEVTGRDGVTTITSPVIIEMKISAPVGVSNANLVKEKQKMDAIIDLDSVLSPLMELSET
jgi:hypothetical protein